MARCLTGASAWSSPQRRLTAAFLPLLPTGDLGRTRPSLGDLLGCQAEIVSLDVTQIHMAFGAEPANGAA